MGIYFKRFKSSFVSLLVVSVFFWFYFSLFYNLFNIKISVFLNCSRVYLSHHVLSSPLAQQLFHLYHSVAVTFNMNYAGDVLTSLVKPIIDISYIICFYTSGDWLLNLGQEGYCTKSDTFYTSVVTPILLLGPYWLRFMQCLRRYRDNGKRHPNLSNALKYALAMLVTLAGVFNPTFSQRGNEKMTGFQIFWILSYFTSTLYSWGWDVLMDWSAIDLQAPGYLRKRRMIASSYYYYFAILTDLVLRFFW